MEDIRDIAAVSLPFTAGVAGAAAAAGGFASQAAAGAAAAAALAAGAGLAALAALRRAGRFHYGFLFFLLGLFCFLTSRLTVPITLPFTGTAVSLRRLISSIPFPHDSTGPLVTALLTGDRSGLTTEQTAAFRASGAAHILALSGLHLGIIYLIISKSLSILGNTPFLRRFRSIAVILLAGFYTLATGAGPSIVRAFLFILIREVCSLFPDRSITPVRTLLAALTIQLALNPGVITSLGFQLSYLAMTGISVLYPRLSAWYPAASSPSESPATHSPSPASTSPLPDPGQTNLNSEHYPGQADLDTNNDTGQVDLDAHQDAIQAGLDSGHDTGQVGLEAHQNVGRAYPDASQDAGQVSFDAGHYHGQVNLDSENDTGQIDIDAHQDAGKASDDVDGPSTANQIFNNIFSKVDRLTRYIWNAAALAISCQIFTAPLAWIRFHTFPKYFLLTNLTAMPLTTILMAASVATIVLQATGCSPAAVTLTASITDTLAQTLLFVLHVISSL